MPPILARVEQIPIEEFRIEVGNSSAVYKKTTAKAADEPNLPIKEKTSLDVESSNVPAMMQEAPHSNWTKMRNGLRPQYPMV